MNFRSVRPGFAFLFFAALLSIWLIFSGQSGAQDSPPPVPLNPGLQKVSTELAAARRKLAGLSGQTKDNATDDVRLADIKVTVDELGRGLQDLTAAPQARLEQIKARLTEIGDPPAEGQPPEAEALTAERNKLTAERGQINAISGEAEAVLAEVKGLSNRITETRRALFTNTLLKHTDLSWDVFQDAGASFVTEVANLNQAITSWLSFVWNYKRLSLGSAGFLSLAAAFVCLSVSRRLLVRFLRHDPTDPDPPYFRRLSIAFWSTMISTLTFTAFLITSFIFMRDFSVLRVDIAPILAAAFGFLGIVYFVSTLTLSVLSPNDPNWRLLSISNDGARFLAISIIAMSVLNGLDYVLSQISETLNSPVVLTVVKSWIASVAISLILIAISFLRPLENESGKPEEIGRPWPFGIALLLRIAGGGILLAALIGYVGLARFFATQIVVTGAVTATMYIGFLSGKAVSERGGFAETPAGRMLQGRYRLSAVNLDQVGLGAGLCIYLFALVTGIPLILMSWGFQLQDLELWTYNLFTSITIGNISISLLGIMGGILIFAIGMVLTRWIQKWLDRNVMERSQVDTGVRNSVKTGIGYVGVGIAALLGISSAGIDLSSLALVAGALSLGIGFGLQNIVSNFVSGLILLVERPFKVGDWIVTGTNEGTVKRISVRATEIETFQRQSIIVPNSDLINASVGNWTHRNRIARSEIPVSVSYDSDARKVMDILLELVTAKPQVLRNPEPHVEFLRFGEFSQDFELRFFLADLSDGLPLRNDLRVEIIERFRQEGINMPSSQRNVNVHVDAVLPQGQGDPKPV